MWNEPTRKQLALIPKLYSTEDVPLQEKKVYMKFFLGSWLWYVFEFDGKDIFFGMVFSPMAPDGELGYFSLRELKSINVNGIEVDREIYGINPRSPKKWKVVKARIMRGSE